MRLLYYWFCISFLVSCSCASSGCKSSVQNFTQQTSPEAELHELNLTLAKLSDSLERTIASTSQQQPSQNSSEESQDSELVLTTYQDTDERTESPEKVSDQATGKPDQKSDSQPSGKPNLTPFLQVPPAPGIHEDVLVPSALSFDELISSITQTYPLLRAIEQERWIAQGNALSAQGKFDTKFKAGAVEAPLGFYENYQHFVGIEQPLYSGANVFAGYRTGRGVFEPWYQERITDDGGEFKLGVQLPLLQNRTIDERRLKVLKTNLEREMAEPLIQAELLEFLRAGTFAYWNWVAAGAKFRIAQDLLEIADTRTKGLNKRLDEGDISQIELTDNQRLIASRQVKLSQARQKLEESAVKLSLFLRFPDGSPRVPLETELPPTFPSEMLLTDQQQNEAFAIAWSNRPDLYSLTLKRKSLEAELAQAVNLARPNLDFELIGSQDVGQPASSKRDKHELELDASLLFSVPLQRREAAGKQSALQAKLRQLRAKEQFTRDKISTQVQAAHIALNATAEQIRQTRNNLDLARKMEAAERTKFDLGESNLLLVNLREKANADAAAELAEAQLAHQIALANYRATLAQNPLQTEPLLLPIPDE